MENKINKNRTTEQKKEDVLEAMNKYRVVTVACSKANVGRTQFYEWKKIDSVFAEAINELEESAKDFAEYCLFQHVLRGNMTAAMFFLNAKAPERGYRFVRKKI